MDQPVAGLVMEFERRLEPADLAMLELAPTKAPALKRIRDSHHALARAISSGMSNIEASRITGFDSTYISILKGDPTFKELVAYYEEHEEAVQADLRERMLLIALDVSQEIRDRVHNDPAIEFKELRALLFGLADRTGHGPSQSIHTQVDIVGEMTYMQQRKLLDALDALDSTTVDLEPSEIRDVGRDSSTTIGGTESSAARSIDDLVVSPEDLQSLSR